MKARLKKLLSCVLALAILIQMAPFEALAADIHEPEAVEPVEVSETVTEPEAAATDEEGSPEVYIQGEVMDAREEYVKHYRLTDGSFIASQFQVPVHYEDDGEWVDIDNTLQPVAMFSGTEVYQAVNGDHAQAFSATLADGTVMSLAQGDMSISMALWDGTTGEEVPVDSEPEATEDPVVEEPIVEEPVVKESLQEEVPTEAAAEKAEEELTAVTVYSDGTSEPEVVAEPETTEEPEAVEEVPAPEEIAEPETVEETEPEAEPEVSSEPEEVTVEEPEAEPETETALPVFNREAYAQVAGNGAIALASLEEPEEELREVTDVVPETLSNEVLYEDVYPNVDLKYETFSYNVKESIILNAPASEATENNASEEAVTGVTPYVYTFLLDLVDLTPALQEDGSILLLDAENEPQFTIPAPYMVDSNEVFSDDVWYTLTEVAEGWLLTVTASEEWLESDDREYPVTIDPTIISKKNESNFVGGTAAENSTTSEVSNTWMAAGYHSTHGKMEAYFKINSMPELDPGCSVVNASIGLNLVDYIPQWNSSAKSVLSLHPVTEATTGSDWLSTLTWANKPAYGDAVDYVNTNGGEIDAILYWDVTRIAKGWYEGSEQNNGLVITSDQTSSTAYRAWFDYSGYAILLLTYRNTTGTEGYYTYETQSAVRAGSGSVGDYSSALTVDKPLLSYSSTTMPYGLSLVFNSGLRSGNIYSFVNSSDITAPDYDCMRTGYGWQLSAMESVMRTKISDTTYLVYRDGDGTQHFFTYNNIKYQYEDEDGLGLVIKVPSATSGTDKEYTMTDDSDNEKKFINGYLYYIKDAVGNAVYFVYNGADPESTDFTTWKPPASDAYLSAIVVVNNGATSGSTICTLAYSNNYLSSVADWSGRTTTFTYSGSKLASITHPDGVVTYYNYNDTIDANHLTSMYDAEAKYGVEYGYSGDAVASINEYTASSNSGTKTYGTKVSRTKNGVQEAIYRYDGSDRVLNNADDIITRYAFDFTGRTINATTLNADQSEIYGVTAAAYSANSGTSKSNNRIEKDMQKGQNGVNLLTAGGGESHDNFSAPSDYWQRTSTDSKCNAVIKTGEEKRTGSNAFKIWLATNAPTDSNGDRRHGLYQKVTLEAGVTYTFSGYANTQQNDLFNDDGGLYVAFGSSTGAILATSEWVKSKTNADIEGGWQRIHATYTPATSGEYRVMVMQENLYSYGFFDDLQLEVGSVPSSASLLQNGSFSGSSEWTLGNYSTANGDSLHPGVISAAASTTGMKRASQTVPINGPATETFLLSGWAWAPSAANTEEKLTDSTAENNTTKRYFGLIARVNYTDETKEYFYMPFNDDYNGWQYASCVITPKKANQSKTINTITVIAAYDCNINTVWFDNISLRKEPCSTYTYDDDGNLTAVNATGNSQQSFTFAAGTSDLTESNTESNGTYKYTYNDDHLVTKIENEGVFMEINYDDYGNSTGTTLSADGNETIGKIKTSAEYTDDHTQIKSQTSATGNKTTYGYNSDRQLVSVDNSDADGVGAVVETTYHTNTDRPKTNFISGVISAQNYYTNGMLSRIKRGGYLPNDTTTKLYQNYYMNYDSFGNMTSVAVGSRTLASYAYAANNGNLQSMTYGNGHVVSYGYDHLDRVTHEYWNNTLKYQYFYNSEGELSKKLDVGTGKAVNYEYDSLGRLIYSWQSDGNEIVQKTEHLYDTENRITTQGWQFRNSDGTYTTTTETYAYNTDGSVYTVTPSSGGVYAFEYDALKRQSGRYNWYYKSNYSYADGKNEGETTTQVSEIFYEHRPGGTSFDEFTVKYTYDALGNITSIDCDEWPDIEATYKYDAQGQLIEETNRNNTFYYTYDTYGNIRTAQKANSTSSTVFSYDDTEWRDLLTAYKGHAISYDAIGNPLNWKNNTTWTSLTWQNGRQLASIASSAKSLSFTYDLAGIRDSKTVVASGVTTTYNFVTQNGQVVRQTWTDGTTSHVMDFLYDNQGRPYAADYDGTRYYYVLSLQGDVLRMVDTTGATAASYVYDSWGRLLTSSGTLKDINPLRYRGYYYDTETKLYYLGSRYYDPLVKRFINSDTSDLVIANPNSLNDKNLFAYCDNNPVMRTDDGGELWTEVFTGIAVVAGITAVAALCVATAGISVGVMAVVGGGYTLTASITSAGATAVALAASATVVSGTAICYAKKYCTIEQFASEHTNNARNSTKNKHEKGQARKKRQEGGDKKRQHSNFSDRSNKRHKSRSESRRY